MNLAQMRRPCVAAKSLDILSHGKVMKSSQGFVFGLCNFLANVSTESPASILMEALQLERTG